MMMAPKVFGAYVIHGNRSLAKRGFYCLGKCFAGGFMKRHFLKKRSDKEGIWKPLLTVALALGILLQSAEATAEGQAAFPQGTENIENIPDAQNARPRSAAGMDEESAGWVDAAGEELAALAAERDIMAVVYLSDTYPIRRQPACDSEAAVTVLSGQQVNILDIFVDENLEVCEYVRLEYNGAEYHGYVPRAYLACSDARFLDWEERFGMNPASSVYAENGRGGYADIEQFPASYRPALLALKEKHPNWIFAKMNTTLDWNTVITEELKDGKSLVYKTFPNWAKDGLYDQGTWYYATREVLELYMDPRNALTEDAVFQFEQLTYNEQYHTLGALEAFLNNTFMKGPANAPGTSMTYAYMIYMIGREKGREVSPFHLAARILQEQGQGDSPLISGKYPGYEGYYNYFNISASGNTDKQVIESGLSYAKNHNWNSAYYSILGGADFISGNYIKKGQDTLYLQKYNVNPNGYYGLYTHQYMQNISAPTTESASIKKLYASAGALDSTFVFKIPVYENMPGEAVDVPEPDTKVSVTVPAGYSGNELWLDGVAYEGSTENGSLTVTAPDGGAKTAVMYRYNSSGVPVGMYVWSLSYNGTSYLAVPEPELENLLTYHGFSIRITGKSGIRFKTGISVDLRSRLLSSSGVNGYRLKEYGTLVMNDKNRERYPMVKGGDKVLSGLSYGRDESGRLTDVVYETVDGRYRFTSVLTGMPSEQYKTGYAFRGYIILEKNGVSYTFYGPPLARNIYGLAGQLLDKGIYEQGSETYWFLKNIMNDADGLPREPVEEEEEKSVSGGDAGT